MESEQNIFTTCFVCSKVFQNFREMEAHMMEEHSGMFQPPGVNVIELFSSAFLLSNNKLERLTLGKILSSE